MQLPAAIQKAVHNRKIVAFALVVVVMLAIMTYTLLGKDGSLGYTGVLETHDVVDLAPGEVLQQELLSQDLTLQELTIRFETYHHTIDGEVHLALYADGECVQKWETPFDMLSVNTAEVFKLDRPVDFSEQGHYYLTLSMQYEGEVGVGVHLAQDSNSGTLTRDGEPLEGSAIVYCLTFKSERHNGLDLFKTAMVCGMTLLVIATAWVLLFTKIKLAPLFFMLVLVFGMCYSVAMTPMSVPDERHHYQSAYQLSNYMLFQWDEPEKGDSSHFTYADYPGHVNTSSGYVRLLLEIGGGGAETGEMIDIPLPRKLSYFVEYIPQATGIAIGRLLGRNFTTIFMLGRWCNLLFYAACVYFAIKRLPRFQVPMGLLALIPMALHQAASYSYDGFVNGVALLLIASILRMIVRTEKVSPADLVWVGVAGALLAPAKVVYCPILLMLFLVDREKFGSMKRKVLAIGVILLVCVLMVGLFQLPSLMEIGTRGETRLNQEGERNYTPSYILRHPFESLEIMVETLMEHGYTWFKSAFGNQLSGFTLSLPLWIVPAFMLLVFLSSINHHRQSPLLSVRGRAWVALLVTGVVFLVILSMFVGWTSNFREIIAGVQGRYFLPILPLLLLVINNNTLVLRRQIDRELIVIGAALNMAALEAILDYTIIR